MPSVIPSPTITTLPDVDTKAGLHEESLAVTVAMHTTTHYLDAVKTGIACEPTRGYALATLWGRVKVRLITVYRFNIALVTGFRIIDQVFWGATERRNGDGTHEQSTFRGPGCWKARSGNAAPRKSQATVHRSYFSSVPRSSNDHV